MGVANPGDSNGTRVANVALVAGAKTISFAARYGAVEVKSLSTVAGEIYYLRTDGTAPASPWNDCYAVAQGERCLIPNQAMLWYQGFGAADGTSGNPGTTVKIASSVSTSTSSIEVVGVG